MSELDRNDLPWLARALLESLGASQALVDDVLGDLAEEHALRNRASGPLPARAWLYAQAVRTAPHLMRDWVRGLRRRDVGSIALATMGGVLVGWLATRVTWILLDRLTFATTGIPLGAYVNHWRTTGDMMSPVGLALASRALIAPLIAGLAAGLIGRRAPLASAIVAAIVFVAPPAAFTLSSPNASAGITAAIIVGFIKDVTLFCAGGTLAALWTYRERSLTPPARGA